MLSFPIAIQVHVSEKRLNYNTSGMFVGGILNALMSNSKKNVKCYKDTLSEQRWDKN